jgi:hypothetical protein
MTTDDDSLGLLAPEHPHRDAGLRVGSVFA